MAMVPHEQLLVKRLEDKPFVLLGIDFDANKEALKKAQEEKKITWRSWFDGSGGPIGKTWRIRFLPTIYVLDAKGVIRYKNVRDKALEDAVDTLLKEMQSKKS